MSLREWFAANDGAQIPGGCGTCDAYQTPSVDALGILHITVYHDDRCPVLRAMKAGRS